jgi:hypothetical protein
MQHTLHQHAAKRGVFFILGVVLGLASCGPEGKPSSAGSAGVGGSGSSTSASSATTSSSGPATKPGEVICVDDGGQTVICSPGFFCLYKCVTGSGGIYKPVPSGCYDNKPSLLKCGDPGAAWIGCDTRDDCPAGSGCVAWTIFKSECDNGASPYALCNQEADCDAGKHCIQKWPTPEVTIEWPLVIGLCQ